MLLILTVNKSLKKTKEELDREIFWYDFKDREMKKFNGGTLDFQYDFENEKLTIGSKPLSVITYQRQNNKEKILQWASDQEELSLNEVESNNYEVIFSFPDDLKNKVSDALWDTDFTYEII